MYLCICILLINARRNLVEIEQKNGSSLLEKAINAYWYCNVYYSKQFFFKLIETNKMNIFCSITKYFTLKTPFAVFNLSTVKVLLFLRYQFSWFSWMTLSTNLSVQRNITTIVQIKTWKDPHR